MKRFVTILLSMMLLFPCIVSIVISADIQSTTVRYSVSATIIYRDYDGTQTTQKVEVGSYLKEPGHKTREGYTFVGWKNSDTGKLWDFSEPVESSLILVATYKKNTEEDTDQTGNQEDVQIGKGGVSVEIKTENGMSGVSIGADKESFVNMLIENGDITPEEVAQLKAGATMDIVLIVTAGETTISTSSQKQMEAVAGDYTIGQYLDISLYKTITVNGKSGDRKQIHTTAGMITVTIKVPDKLINTDKTVERSYCILRNHEGTVEKLSCTYDADTHILTFQTNQFSDYAIAYKDVRKTETEANTEQNPTSEKVTEKQNATSYDSGAPGTGDETDWISYLALLGAAFLLIIGTVAKKSH